MTERTSRAPGGQQKTDNIMRMVVMVKFIKNIIIRFIKLKSFYAANLVNLLKIVREVVGLNKLFPFLSLLRY